MKQKCQLQMGIVKYKNAATPLSTLGINTTCQDFQMSTANVLSVEIPDVYLRSKSKIKHMLLLQIFVCDW